MSVASAVNPVISQASDPKSELARQFLYFMKMMREVEDRFDPLGEYLRRPRSRPSCSVPTSPQA